MTADLYEEMFCQALRIRRAEERIVELYPSDKIQSPVHLSIGQEAVAVGICRPLKKEDLIFSTYRSHALYLAKGGDLKKFFAELYGKQTGCGKGKAGSMHLLAPEVGMMPVSAVVASTIPHAVGAALAARKLKKNQITLAVFGDGAVEQGVFHESLNFASLSSAPVIFICENNHLAVHSHLAARQSFKIRALVKAYGIPFTNCKAGYDFAAVEDAFAGVVDQARRKQSPQFIEVDTCRYMEHVGTGDDLDAGYRSRQEVGKWKAKDPLIVRKDLAAKYDPAIRAEIDAAVEFAENSPWPSERELLTDVI